MNLDDFQQQIQHMQERLVLMQQQTQPTLSQQQQLELVTRAFQELSTAVEELQIANEQLFCINDELSVAHQRYQDLFDFAPDAYLVTDPHGLIQEANCAAATLLNDSQPFLAGKFLVRYIIKEQRRAFYSKLTELGQVDRVQEWEVCLQPRNSTLITAAITVAVVRDQEGRTIGLRWMLRDISERKQAEEAQRRHEQEFSTLVENAPDLIARFDRQLRHLYVNPVAEQITGIPRSEFIGKTNRELNLPEPNVSNWERMIQKIFETGSEAVFEFSLITPTGLRHYQGRFVPEFSADGAVESVIGICRDTTERRQSEEAILKSEQLFRQIAENIQEVLWISSLDFTKLIYVSPAYEKIWGRTCESLYQKPISWIETVHPEDRDRVLSALEKHNVGEYNTEYRIIKPDGTVCWISDRGFPVRDEQGRLYRLAGLAKDITSHKLAEAEVEKALQKERELNELKSRFISISSHEFRTPLTTISSSAELLERYRDRFSQEKQLTHLHRIKTAVGQMTQLLDDVLLVGKAEAGRLEFNPEPLDLVSFCRDLLAELQLSDQNQHKITFTYQGSCTLTTQGTNQSNDVLPVLDEKLLRHLLGNLLSNAIKYSPSGCAVQLNLGCFDNQAIFKIQDSGIGIPPEDLPHLFETFHRASNVGTIQGTGLGLAIVKQCVDLHRGEITVESVVGKGTTFTIKLPLNDETAREAREDR